MTVRGNGSNRRPAWPDRLVKLFGVLVPEHRRNDWVREWQAELDAASSEAARAGRAWRAAGRVVAAAEDALRYGAAEWWREGGSGWLREVRQAARALARAPLFTTTVVLTLGIGVGANAALFAVINAALLEPLPYPEPDRLVVLGTMWTREANPSRFVSTPDFDDLVERMRSVEAPTLRVENSVTYQANDLLRSFLFGVDATDPLTYGGVGLGLTAIALACAWIPARRATRVRPADALRADA